MKTTEQAPPLKREMLRAETQLRKTQVSMEAAKQSLAGLFVIFMHVIFMLTSLCCVQR